MSGERLGQSLHVLAVAVRGRRTDQEWQSLVHALTAAAGMTPVHHSIAWRYPTDDGRGGVGVTIVQPIAESFLAVDVWPAEHGAYVVLCSCRPFDRAPVLAALRATGLEPIGSRLDGRLSVAEPV